MKIILASQSPRRKELLNKIGLTFKVIPSDFNESEIIFDGNPEKYCEELAYNKAKKVSNNYKDCILLICATWGKIQLSIFFKFNRFRKWVHFCNDQHYDNYYRKRYSHMI